MNILRVLFHTSIGKKAVMAVTGFILLGFVVGHMIGNFQIFLPPNAINAYAHALQSLGPALWAIRIGLLVAVGLHIWVSIKLVLENKAARKNAYEGQQTLRASYASRTMRYSGPIIALFIVYHILHFTAKTTHGEGFYPMAELNGEAVPDVHSMMVLGFQQPLTAGFYLLAIALLSIHLSHGISSMFQSLGLRSRSWTSALNKCAIVLSVLYFLGNAAIVGAVFTGYVKIQNPEVYAVGCSNQSADCPACQAMAATHH